MSNDLKLSIRLTADGKDLVGTVRVAKSEINSLGTVSTKAAVGTRSLASSMDSGEMSAGRYADTVQRAKGALFAYIGLATAKHLIDEADQWNRLQIRIKTATRATGDYNRVASELLDITLQNGSEMESSVALFQSLARASGELGATNSDILTLTRTVQQLGAMSGTSTANMKAGLTQFSQAMSAGVVRAEEFNSLLENIPEVANRIAVGMGMTVGELRNAVLEGEVLSKDVFDALLGQADEVNSQFEQLPLTLDRATSRLSTSFDHFLGQLDQATGATSLIAKALDGAARSLEKLNSDSQPDSNPVTADDVVAQRAALQDEVSRLERRIAELNAVPGDQRDFRQQQELSKALREVKILKLELVELDQFSIDVIERENEAILERSSALTKGHAEYRRMLEEQWSAEDDAAVRQEQNAQRQRLAKEQLLVMQRRTTEEAREYNDMMAEGKALTMAMLKPTELYEQRLDRLFDLYGAGAISLETFNRAQERYMKDLAESSKTAADEIEKQTKRMEQAGESASSSFQSAWSEAIKKGEADFASFADAIIDEILRIQYEMTIAKPISGWFTQLFSSLFGAAAGGGYDASSDAKTLNSQISSRPETGATLLPAISTATRTAGRSAAASAPVNQPVTIIQNNDFSNISATDEAVIAAMLEENRRQTEAAIYSQINRGGSAARIVGRRG